LVELLHFPSPSVSKRKTRNISFPPSDCRFYDIHEQNSIPPLYSFNLLGLVLI
jgi:hypothetical protein